MVGTAVKNVINSFSILIPIQMGYAVTVILIGYEMS